MALVINKLNVPGRYVATQDLVDYVEHAMRERFSDTAGVELRTLQRDFKTIEALFGLVIRFSRRHGGYYIAGQEENSIVDYTALLLNFELLSAIDADSTVQKYVLAEHRRPEFRSGRHVQGFAPGLFPWSIERPLSPLPRTTPAGKNEFCLFRYLRPTAVGSGRDKNQSC